MKSDFLHKKLRLFTLVAVAAVFFAVGGVQRANASHPSIANSTWTLTDGNSSVKVDDGVIGGKGMYSWIIDGTEHMNKQWFWTRADADGKEVSIDALTLIHSEYHGIGLDEVHLTYVDPSDRFNVDVKYTLSGGVVGSQTASITETILVNNLKSSSLDLNFFQYTDLNLDATPGGDSGGLPSPVLVPGYWEQTDNTGILFTEEVQTTTVKPTRYQVALTTPLATSILTSLDDLGVTTLTGTPATATAGPGDVAFAWEWDKTLGVGGSLSFTKGKTITAAPEPISMSLFLFGGVTLAARRYYKRKQAKKV
jgi:hypothetical protein